MSIFEENLKMAFSESQYDLCMRNKDKDLHYQGLEKEWDKLFTTIQKRLGKKHRKLMSRLEELQNEIGSTDGDLIYMQGMIDCVILLKTIKLI